MKDILQAGKKPATMLAADDMGLEGMEDPLCTLSTRLPERKARHAEVFEGDDRQTVEAFLSRISERL